MCRVSLGEEEDGGASEGGGEGGEEEEEEEEEGKLRTARTAVYYMGGNGGGGGGGRGGGARGGNLEDDGEDYRFFLKYQVFLSKTCTLRNIFLDFSLKSGYPRLTVRLNSKRPYLKATPLFAPRPQRDYRHTWP